MKMFRRFLRAGLCWAAGLAAFPVLAYAQATPAPGDAVAGKGAYAACQACHDLDANKAGPKHRGLVGRKAATAAGFKYSVALRDSGLTWTAQNLDAWLQDPGTMVPGTKMYFLVSDAKQRADIIAYLATEK